MHHLLRFLQEKNRDAVQLDFGAGFECFRDLPPAFIRHIIADTLCMPVDPDMEQLTTETRLMIGACGAQVGGYEVRAHIPRDQYHPHRLQPFKLRALWLPISVGEFFTLGSAAIPPEIVRKVGDTDSVLFPIHPKSETLYAPLLQEYPDRIVELSAIALSSSRSLVLALPKVKGKTQFVIAKVSLDADVGWREHRVIALKDCANAVANTGLLYARLPDDYDLRFLGEPAAFVPTQSFSPCAGMTDEARRFGVIYREIPAELNNPDDDKTPRESLIPVFALFGVDNRPFFLRLIEASGESATDFLTQKVLRPLARAFTDLIYFQQTSIQAHAQNLLFSLDEDLRITGLVYRDMGGVNCLADDRQFLALPPKMRSKEFFYFDTHLLDGAVALEEFFVGRVLFNLTKQMVKSHIERNDWPFAQWTLSMSKQNFLANWSTGNSTDDQHAKEIPIQDFCRYGYTERIFAQLILDELEARGVFSTIGQLMQLPKAAQAPIEETIKAMKLTEIIAPPPRPLEISRAFFQEMFDTPSIGYRSPCIDRYWFKELILLTNCVFAHHDLLNPT
jgi:hypothetical protein